MIELLQNLLGGVALGLGCFFLISGAVGLLRFPDFYSRMHAAGVTDTLATSLIIAGLMLMAGWGIALIKLALILLFVFFTSPTASHALARAAQHSELRLPELKKPLEPALEIAGISASGERGSESGVPEVSADQA